MPRQGNKPTQVWHSNSKTSYKNQNVVLCCMIHKYRSVLGGCIYVVSCIECSFTSTYMTNLRADVRWDRLIKKFETCNHSRIFLYHQYIQSLY